MLEKLHIQNFALIKDINIEFGEGLNCLSGETGAGKSIILDALIFIAGGKSDKSLIRYGCEKTCVEAILEIKEESSAGNILKKEGLWENEELLLMRTLHIDGKNEIRINGRLCTLSLLKTIACCAIEILQQSEHLEILNPQNHLNIIDEFYSDENLKNNILNLNNSIKAINLELSKYGNTEAERIRTMDLLSFQITEIDNAALIIGEDIELDKKKRTLSNLEKINNNLCQCIDILNNNAILANLNSSYKILNSVSEYDDRIEKLANRIDSSKLEIDDIICELNRIHNRMEYNENELIEIENRLELIYNLKRKYGNTIDDILIFRKNAYENLQELDMATEKISILLNQKKTLINELYDLCTILHNNRLKNSMELSQNIENELHELGMKDAKFVVHFSDVPTIEDFYNSINIDNFDKVEFFMSANIGQPLKPLIKVISGGELSRFMLAIKNINCHLENISTTVFDEIDTGISGNIAKIVAIKLMKISRDFQCIAITHLPQVAAIADRNFYIEKHSINNETITTIKLLNNEEKISEISRLSGSSIGQHAFLNAKDIIAWGEEEKLKIKQ